MTDITDHDRRQLREDAKAVINKTAMRSSAAVSIARHILATVDAPEPTLAEDLARIAESSPVWTIQHVCDELKFAAARAEQMEHDLAAHEEATGAWEQLTARLIAERDEARDEVERLTADTSAAARVILATVDAPAPTPAEALRDMLEKRDACEAVSFSGLLARVEQVQQERDEACAEVARLTTQVARQQQLMKLHGVHRDTVILPDVQKDAESNAETIDPADVPLPMPPGDIPGTALPINISAIVPDPTTPSPADVRPGEAWLVEVDGERRHALKDDYSVVPWNTINADGCSLYEDNGDVTLIARLVPEPRTVRYEPKEK